MREKAIVSMSRRSFLASGIILGNTLFGTPLPPVSNTQANPRAKETLSSSEKKWVDDSILSQNLKKYFHEGYSCAESIFLVSLQFLKKPEEWVWAAAGFGGGMYNRDLCGFLTGGIMALGCASGMLKMPREDAKEYCGEFVKEYWGWWGKQAPYHCADLRSDEPDSAVCTNQGLLSAAKIEELFRRIQAKS